MAPHIIRLRGPWTLRRLTADPPAIERRLFPPVAWSMAEWGSIVPVEFERRFHRPTGLDDGACVWLRASGPFAGVDVRVNSAMVSNVSDSPEIFLADVTQLLEPMSCMTFRVPGFRDPFDPCALISHVQLEIVEPA